MPYRTGVCVGLRARLRLPLPLGLRRRGIFSGGGRPAPLGQTFCIIAGTGGNCNIFLCLSPALQIGKIYIYFIAANKIFSA